MNQYFNYVLLVLQITFYLFRNIVGTRSLNCSDVWPSMSTWYFVEGLRDSNLRGIGMFGRDHVLLKTYVCECTTYSRPSTSWINYLNIGTILINNRSIEHYIQISFVFRTIQLIVYISLVKKYSVMCISSFK